MAFLSHLYNISSYAASSITQCRRSRKALRGLEQTSIPLDALPNVVVLTNKDGQILDINKIGTEFLRYEKTELLGKHLHQLMPSSDEKQASGSRWTFTQETEHPQDTHKIVTFVRKDGSLFPANVSVAKFSLQNGEEQFLTTITDCTEHQKKLNTANMYAIHLLHDTRGSLGVIQNALGTLKTCEITPEVKDPIDSIRIGTADIASLVNDTLDLTKVLKQDTLELSECYLKGFLTKILKPSQELAKARKKKLTLSIDTIPPDIYCFLAKDALAVVLRNLLSNAIKFTPTECETPICCEISLAPVSTSERNALLSFKVTNQGEGFSKEQKQRIFFRFQQASSEISKKYGGTGIGLPQSKEAIEKAGGSLDSDSTPNQTTIFYGTLPVGITQAPATLSLEPTEIKMPRTPNGGRRVLLVDDDSIPLKAGSRNLERSGGHKVVTAKTIEEALGKAGDANPEILITDMNLGTPQNGIDLAKLLKQSPLLTHRPLKTILLTGTLDEITVQKAKEAGIDRCILKGSDPQVLQEAIIELCTPSE